MRTCRRVVCVLALVASGLGCTSLAPGRDLSSAFLKRGEVVFAAEQQPQEITVVSTSGNTATIQWKTTTAHEPFVALYGQTFDGGRLIAAASIRRDQQLQSGYVTMGYTSSDDELHHEIMLSGLRYGCPTALGMMDYCLQIDSQFVTFTIDGNAGGLKEPMSSGVPYSPPMPTSCPPTSF